MELNRFPGGLVVPQEWLDGIATQLRATGVDIIKQTLLTVMQDYFRHSNAWRMWVGPVLAGGPAPPVPGRRVPIDPPAPNVAIRTVFEVEGLDGWKLRRIAPTAYRMSDARLLGNPTGWYQTVPGVIVFDQVPPAGAATFECAVYASLAPNDLCLPQAMHTEHYDALCAGTMARLCAIKGPNFNLALSGMHERNYRRARGLARWDAENGFSIETTLARGRPFARGSQGRGQSTWRS